MKQPPLPESYFALVRKHPLCYIHTPQQARKARKVLGSIILHKQPDELDAGEKAYIECLATLLDFYKSL